MVSPDHVRNAEKWLLAAEDVLEDEPGLDVSTVRRAQVLAGGHLSGRSALDECLVAAAGALVSAFLAERSRVAGDDWCDIIAAAANALAAWLPIYPAPPVTRTLFVMREMVRRDAGR